MCVLPKFKKSALILFVLVLVAIGSDQPSIHSTHAQSLIPKCILMDAQEMGLLIPSWPFDVQFDSSGVEGKITVENPVGSLWFDIENTSRSGAILEPDEPVSSVLVNQLQMIPPGDLPIASITYKIRFTSSDQSAQIHNEMGIKAGVANIVWLLFTAWDPGFENAPYLSWKEVFNILSSSNNLRLAAKHLIAIKDSPWWQKPIEVGYMVKELLSFIDASVRNGDLIRVIKKLGGSATEASLKSFFDNLKILDLAQFIADAIASMWYAPFGGTVKLTPGCFSSSSPEQLPAPNLVAPSDGRLVTSLHPQLSWTSVTGATGYSVRIASLDNTVVKVAQTTTILYITPTLVPNLQYRWQVTAFNQQGIGAPSSWRTFTTPNQSPPLPPTCPYCTDRATFISDITYPDGAIVAPDQALIKTWRVRNTGTSTWDGYKLKFISGKQMQGPSEITIPTTPPGATVDVTLNLVAPSTLGIAKGTWQIVDRDGTWVPSGQLWISVNVQSQNNNIILTANPPSPASADQVRIYAKINNFANLRALRVRVDGQTICELGATEIKDCIWHTQGYSGGQHTIVAEADDWLGIPWDSPQRKSLVYQLNGSAIANHAPDRPTLQSPYDWYLKDASGAPASVQMCVSSVNDPDGDSVQYWFEVLDVPGNPVKNSGWTDSTCWEPTIESGVYSWHVKAGDGVSESDWSEQIWHFSVAEGGVSIGDPTVYQASDPDNTHFCVLVTYGGIIAPEVRAFINLAADGSESGEWVQLDHYGPNTTPDCTQPNVHGFWVRSAKYLTGTHLIRISAVKRDPQGNETSNDARTFTHNIPFMRPPNPQLITPSTAADNGIWWNTTSIMFQWEEALRTGNYQLRVSTQQDLWNDPAPLVDVTLPSTTTTYDHTFAQDYPQLYWAVRASNAAGTAGSGPGVWFGIDRVVPTCTVAALPTVTWDNTFQVSWGGADNSAGIGYYDIQYMDSNRGPWNDWQLNMPMNKTSDLFIGQPGHSYSFRCRATDNAGNPGLYPADGNTSTLIDLTARPTTPWWDNAFASKHNITVLNNMAAIPLPAGYPVRLRFDNNTTPTAAEIYNASQSANKCDDLRLVNNDTTELDRVVDACSSAAIDLWFRTQVEVAAGASDNTSYQLYYGNPAAVNPLARLDKVFWPGIDSNTLRYYAMREGAGNTLHDATGHGNAIMSSGLSWTQAGKFGPAVQFPTDDGPEPRPAIDGGAAFMPVNAFTVEFWLKRGPVDGGSIANQIVEPYPSRWSIFIDGSTMRLSVWPDSVSVSATVENNRSLSDPTFYNQFHHFAITFDGGNQVRFYIDGVLDAVRTLPRSGLTTSTSPLRIGASDHNNARLSGQMFGFVLSEGVKTDFSYGTFAAITSEPSAAIGAQVVPLAAKALAAQLAVSSPDLAVLNVNTYPNPDGGVLVEVVIENQSDVETQNGFFTDLYLDHVPTFAGDFSGSVWFWVNDPIAAGAQLTLTTVITNLTDANGMNLQAVGPAGELRGILSVQTDSVGAISEANELNNIYALDTEICLAAPDAFEGDNISENAILLSGGETQLHNFDRPGDEDWVKFYAQAGTKYIFNTFNLSAIADTTLSLYDMDGLTLLASNDDFNESLASQIEWTAPATGIFYVLVQNWNPNSGGCGTSYHLEMKAYHPPQLTINPSTVVVNEGQIALSGGLVGDPDGDAVTLSASFGTVIDNGDGTWTWDAITTDGPFESQTVTITANDGQNGLNSAIIFLSVHNVAPTANFGNNSSAANVGEAVTLTFTNAFDPSPLDVAAGFRYSYDCTNDGVFEVLDSGGASHDCIYIDPGVFTVLGRIKDKDGGFTDYTSLIVVNKVNAPPVANNDSITIDPGSSGIIDVLANDTDPDGDVLRVASVTNAGHGQVVLNPDGTITYIPDLGFSGDDGFSYIVTDDAIPEAGEDTADVTVIVQRTNKPPDIDNPGDQNSHEGDAIVFQISSYDPDGDTLRYSAGNLPLELSVDPVTGVISGTIKSGAVGIYPVTITVIDPAGLSASTTFQWLVNPSTDPPAAPINLTATVVSPTQLDLACVDNAFNETEFQIERSSDNGVTFVSLASVPPDTVNYPDTSAVPASSYCYRIRALNAFGSSDYSNIACAITPPIDVNDPPTIINPGDQTNEEGDSISLPITASDPDGDMLRYSAVGLPSTLTLDPVTGLITGNLAASGALSSPYTVIVTVTDPTGLAANVTFLWNITEPQDLQLTSLCPRGQFTVYNPGAAELGFTWDVEGTSLAGAGTVIAGGEAFFITGTVQGVVRVLVNGVVVDSQPTINNCPPDAQDDTASTDINVPVNIIVLLNDTDPDGDTLIVVSIIAPSNGTAVINSDYSITYTPNIGFVGTDVVEYRISDAANPEGQDSARVTVTVNAPPPQCTSPNPKADLKGSLPQPSNGIIINNSSACSYLVGMASYKQFDNILDNQEIMDWETAIIGPGQTLNLFVDVPTCSYQIDLFFGEVIMKFDPAHGVKYGQRLLAYDTKKPGELPYCDKPVQQSATTKDSDTLRVQSQM